MAQRSLTDRQAMENENQTVVDDDNTTVAGDGVPTIAGDDATVFHPDPWDVAEEDETATLLPPGVSVIPENPAEPTEHGTTDDGDETTATRLKVSQNLLILIGSCTPKFT